MNNYHNEISYQTIFINEVGTIILSTDSLFSTIDLKQRSTLIEFPFIASIFETLIRQPIGKVFQFKKVETVHNYLPGIYDYTFTNTPMYTKFKRMLIWKIFDKSDVYQKALIEQQIRQEYIIKSERKTN